jgi:hypothetical protein
LQNNSASKLYKVRYCLQIISSLIFEYKQRSEGEVVVYVENVTKANKANTSAVPEAQGSSEPKSNAMSVDTYEKEFPPMTVEDASPTEPRGTLLDKLPDEAGFSVDSVD